MLRANLIQIFLVDNSYESRVKFFKRFNHSLVTLSNEELTFTDDKVNSKFTLNYLEEDAFTKIFLSEFEDGTPLRVIRPMGAAKQMSAQRYNSRDEFTVGSLNPDGYSVSFILTEKNDIRNIEIVIKGVDEQLQSLITGAMMALQNSSQPHFYNISRRLISSVGLNNKDIHQFDDGSNIAQVLKETAHLYDEIEQRIIANL